MNQTALAIMIAGVLVAGSIWLTAPRYAITTERDRAMRIDTANGKLSVCRSTNFVNEPICSPWGERSFDQLRSERKVPPAAAPKPRESSPEETQRLFNELLDGKDTSQQ